MSKQKKRKPLNTYEVYWPIPLCEIYRVKATSEAEAMRIAEAQINSGLLECIGEANGSAKKVVLVYKGDEIDYKGAGETT